MGPLSWRGFSREMPGVPGWRGLPGFWRALDARRSATEGSHGKNAPMLARAQLVFGTIWNECGAYGMNAVESPRIGRLA